MNDFRKPNIFRSGSFALLTVSMTKLGAAESGRTAGIANFLVRGCMSYLRAMLVPVRVPKGSSTGDPFVNTMLISFAPDL